MMILKKLSALGFAVALLATTFSAQAMEETSEFQRTLLAKKEEICNREKESNQRFLAVLQSPEAKYVTEQDKAAMIEGQKKNNSACLRMTLETFQTLKKYNDEKTNSLLKSLNVGIESLKDYLEREATEEEKGEVSQELAKDIEAKATLEAKIASDELCYQGVVKAITKAHENALADLPKI